MINILLFLIMKIGIMKFKNVMSAIILKQINKHKNIKKKARKNEQ